jgi:hypothetical protein
VSWRGFWPSSPGTAAIGWAGAKTGHKHQTFNAQLRYFASRHRTSNVVVRPIIGCSAFDVECSMFSGFKLFLYKFPADGVYVMKT